jgi:hypothetical protein
MIWINEFRFSLAKPHVAPNGHEQKAFAGRALLSICGGFGSLCVRAGPPRINQTFEQIAGLMPQSRQ